LSDGDYEAPLPKAKKLNLLIAKVFYTVKLKIFLSIDVLIDDFKEASLVLNDAQGGSPNLHL
jgi:hypothetical protein